MKPKKKTKIICTIGPATATREKILGLIDAGMDIARINFSHSNQNSHEKTYELLRECEQESGRPLGILADLQGPKIRTTKLKEGSIQLINGKKILINNIPDFIGDESELGCTYVNLISDLDVGNRVLIDDGKLVLSVVSVDKKNQKAELEVIVGGTLKESKGINLPGTPITAPALTEKDIDDLKFALNLGVDYIALSFVRRASDLEFARQFMKDTFTGLVAKIERPEAIDNLAEIIETCDAIMIARGDLGVEMDTEQVPVLQKEIIHQLNQKGKPVITATQMLESMIDNPRPTRAEASDVANAVMDGTDAVMLSAESASGSFPLESVDIMSKIIRKTESSFIYATISKKTEIWDDEKVRTALGIATEQIARSMNAKAIINFTRSGASALLSSEFRPEVPIYSFTPFLMTARKMKLYWGVEPYVMPMMDKFPDMIAFMNKTLKSEGLVKEGDIVVILSGAPGSVAQTVDFIQIYTIR
ncbi:pyruvate kinase [Leptospira sp. GIMC2001]|nr:pyruvate kinase [Leptospira sp. GIMC2001]WCL48242.1 pyruvate kinase [Leptospira sp. GIMC2001]